MDDYIMMNKRRTSLMAAVLVGTMMLFTPVQAGVFNKLGKVLSKGFKVVRMVAEFSLFAGGAVTAVFISTLDSPETIRQLTRPQPIPNIISGAIGFTEKLVGGNEQLLFTHARKPAIALASCVALCGLVAFCYECRGNNNKSETRDENRD